MSVINSRESIFKKSFVVLAFDPATALEVTALIEEQEGEGGSRSDERSTGSVISGVKSSTVCSGLPL